MAKPGRKIKKANHGKRPSSAKRKKEKREKAVANPSLVEDEAVGTVAVTCLDCGRSNAAAAWLTRSCENASIISSREKNSVLSSSDQPSSNR